MGGHRELQGATYGGEKEGGTDELKHVAGMFKDKGTMADIGEAWEARQSKKREGTKRFKTVKVAGVGDVNVLNDNDYEMGQVPY